jgi:hypothetical protein
MVLTVGEPVVDVAAGKEVGYAIITTPEPPEPGLCPQAIVIPLAPPPPPPVFGDPELALLQPEFALPPPPAPPKPPVALLS